jgi:hypothetical protein
MSRIVEGIQEKIRERRYEFSRHAVDQSILRAITIAEFEEALLGKCELIEDYPDDKYGPACLVSGFTAAGRSLHAVMSYPGQGTVKVITLYEPNSAVWIDHRRRRGRGEQGE